jgi:ribosomal protein S18 acetylase RimI-like enzyme
MTTGQIRPFRRSDRDQVTALVNAHAQAVVPGVSVSVNTVLSHLEREPGEFLVDPWVRERVTLVAEQRGRISAVAHLVRYGTEPEVGPAMRDTADIRWLLHWPDQPIWPDASAAGLAVAEAAVAVLRRWRARRTGADLGSPTPGVYGVPEQWPHICTLLERVGFVRGTRTELVYLADVDRLPRANPVPGLEIVRTLGVAGTRFSARLGGGVVGYVEVDTGISGAGRITRDEGWADIGNLQVDPAHRRRGIGTRLLAEVGDWLRLARVPRLLDYATPDETDHLAFLERHGFRLLTRTDREWELPT